MNDPELPDNVNAWPSDPFALFGVTRTVTQGELRKIYARLIRLYKPERSPEQFRRIREAYEALQRYCVWTEMRAGDSKVEIASPAEAESESIATQEEGNNPRQPLAGATVETAEECWSRAMAGELERAYQALVLLQQRDPNRPALYLRLYWLLVAVPELDTTRAPCDWLAKGLASCASYAGLLDHYTEELLDCAEEVLGARFNHLLEQARGSLLVELLERRWLALSQLERWDVALRDLEAFADTVIRDDEVAWLRLLLSLAAKSFSLPRPSKVQPNYAVFQDCQNRMRKLGHLSLSHAGAFDRAEAIKEMSSESIGVLPATVFCFVKLYVAGRLEEASAAGERFLALVASEPGAGLSQIHQTALEAPAVFREFGRALEWLGWNKSLSEDQTHSEAAMQILVYRLLDELADRSANRWALQGGRNSFSLTIESPVQQPLYPRIRTRLLSYCCEENLSPQDVCQVLESLGNKQDNLRKLIAADVPLHWTYWAYRLACEM